jgi:hypothetical protein
LALMLGLDAVRAAIEWISIVTSFVNGAPVHLSAVENTLKGMATNDPRVKRTLVDLLPDQIVAKGISEGSPLDPDDNSIVNLALDCFSRAVQQALVS